MRHPFLARPYKLLTPTFLVTSLSRSAAVVTWKSGLQLALNPTSRKRIKLNRICGRTREPELQHGTMKGLNLALNPRLQLYKRWIAPSTG